MIKTQKAALSVVSERPIKKTLRENNNTTDWVSLVSALGLIKFSHVPADGKIHAVATETHPKKKNGRVMLRVDGSGWAWNHETDARCDWQPGNRKHLSSAHKQRIYQETTRRNKEQGNRYAEAAKVAAGIWETTMPAPEKHPYLVRKKIQPHGVHCSYNGTGNRLVIPVCNAADEIQSLQYIDTDGSKRFLVGGKIREGRFRIGGQPMPDGTIVICEGFATASTIFQETGYVTYAAFSAANLRPVACSIRAQYPNATIIIAGDNDYGTEARIGFNPGANMAKAAAKACGGKVALPPSIEGGTDWNDYYRLTGKAGA